MAPDEDIHASEDLRGSPGRNTGWIVAMIVVVALVGLLLWWLATTSTQPTQIINLQQPSTQTTVVVPGQSGPQGPQGQPGPQGPAGAPGPSAPTTP